MRLLLLPKHVSSDRNRAVDRRRSDSALSQVPVDAVTKISFWFAHYARLPRAHVRAVVLICHLLLPLSSRARRVYSRFSRQHPEAGQRFWEFFSVNIRNPNTRRAYLEAVGIFAGWCAEPGLPGFMTAGTTRSRSMKSNGLRFSYMPPLSA